MSNETNGSPHQGQTDGAALGAGVVGVAVAMLMQPGPFTLLTAIIGLALGLVILGYMGGHRRTVLQSIGFASVMGVLVMPIVGTLLERSTGPDASSVDISLLAEVWAASTVIGSLIDRVWQRSLLKKA